MGVLKSDLFKDDARLEACATTPSAHIALTSPPQKGERVAKIHAALANLQPDGPVIADPEEEQLIYGPTTAEAVLGYKRARNIINLNYQTTADNIVGQMTIKAMDAELLQCGAGQGRRPGVPGQPGRASQGALSSPRLAR